jgi:DNA-binding transcriptional LysR family regulator
MELGSNEAIKQAVMAKLGISILSRHAVGTEIRERRLAVLNVQGFPIAWDWYLGYPSRRKLSVLGEAFLSFLREDGRRIALEVSG